jgi:hypothetical protein
MQKFAFVVVVSGELTETKDLSRNMVQTKVIVLDASFLRVAVTDMFH